MRLGLLCSGIGGLDLAVEQVTGARPWVAEIDPFRHYEQRHPERDRGDWSLRAWPDGEQVLIGEPA